MHMHYDAADLPAMTQVAMAAASVGQPMREDASIFFARQLDYVRARVYEAPRPAMRAFDIMPVRTEVPAWAETITTRTFTEVGMAKIISNYADDLPRADVGGTEQTVRVRDVGDSYGYNVSELRASEATGANLPTRKANAARRAVDIKMSKIAMIGDAQYNMFGLLNHPNIGITTGLTGDWENPATTALQILADLNILKNAITLQSKGIHRATMMALPLEEMTAIETKLVPDSGGRSVIQVFRDTNPGSAAITFIPVVELANSGPSGQDVIIVAEMDAENYGFELVMPFNQLPAQARNLEFVVNCLARTGGVVVDYPLSLTKAYI